MSGDKVCMHIKRDSFNNWSDGTFIPEVKRKEIQQNLKDAMEFQGMEVVVN